ncbi:MAG: hypothetical protein U5L73_11410 [Rhodoferax sp.]|uniref:hypothetical protein n=1 Tax=Rhodoferax sp. TaxID=50421 RepID=UPI002ACD8156|nr:hypothetical protein [Rhodoferax sp.]MDZ7892350.1 hypothetical protein [Rhodoferax sp.]
MTDCPNTGAPAKEATAVVQRVHYDQRLAFENGEAISVFTKRVPIEAVDFYPEQQTK